MRLIHLILLAVLGFGAIILEFFVPSAGLIGIVGGGCVIAGIVFTFKTYGAEAGTLFLIACVITGPVLMFLYFKIFPRSPIGKKLILHRTQNREAGFHTPPELNEGEKGVSTTDLRPSGKIVIDDKEYSVSTEGEYIEKGENVIVTKVEGNRITVQREE